jgi:hypothetical protein
MEGPMEQKPEPSPQEEQGDELRSFEGKKLSEKDLKILKKIKEQRDPELH